MQKLNYDTIKHYQSFTSIQEMDQHVRDFLYKFKLSLSEGGLKVLYFLWKYSFKVVGVSFAKYDTIATGVGLSRRTVIRAVKVLEELSFIKGSFLKLCCFWRGIRLIVIVFLSKWIFILRKELQI